MPWNIFRRHWIPEKIKHKRYREEGRDLKARQMTFCQWRSLLGSVCLNSVIRLDCLMCLMKSFFRICAEKKTVKDEDNPLEHDSRTHEKCCDVSCPPFYILVYLEPPSFPTITSPSLSAIALTSSISSSFKSIPYLLVKRKAIWCARSIWSIPNFFGLQLWAFFLNLVYFHGEYFRVNQLLVKHSIRNIWIFVLSFLFFMIIRRILTCHTRRCIQRWRCCRPRLDRLSQRFRRGLDMRFLIIIIYHNLLFWSRLFRRFFAMTETIVLSPSHHFCLL